MDTVEVIIVDNGSTDYTSNVCSDIKIQFPKINWQYFYDNTPGLLTGRHLGAKMAKGEIFAYLDDDVILERSWLDAITHAFSGNDISLTGGPTYPHFESDPPWWLNDMWEEYEDGVRVLGELSLVDLGSEVKFISPLYVPGANFAIRKVAFQSCKGFNPDCMPLSLQRYQGNGETGLALKLKEKNLKALYHPGAAVRHVIPVTRLTAKSFEEKGFYQGVGGSYSRIRRQGALIKQSKSWKDYLRPVKWKLERDWLLRNLSAKNMRFLISRARLAGRWYHENEVQRDRCLLSWILKPHYIDYKLPDGWEKHSQSSRNS